MKTTLVLLIMLAALPAQAAGNAAAAESNTKVCAACHGVKGISSNSAWPNIAGQKSQYLMAQLRAFRDGDRVNPMMSPMAKPLTDQNIEDPAAYYSAMSCE